MNVLGSCPLNIMTRVIKLTPTRSGLKVKVGVLPTHHTALAFHIG